jgi:hypothetical protein
MLEPLLLGGGKPQGTFGLTDATAGLAVEQGWSETLLKVGNDRCVNRRARHRRRSGRWPLACCSSATAPMSRDTINVEIAT